MSKTVKTALVCGGGGARGAYHVGVWKALRELDIDIDISTGSSVGSLVAAMVAQGDFETAERIFSGITYTDVVDVPLNDISLTSVTKFLTGVVRNAGVDTAPLEKLLRSAIDEQQIRQSKTRFGLVTVRAKDLVPNELTIDDIPEGKLVDYLIASCGIFPGFKVKKLGGDSYIDGGFYDNVPISLAEDLGATDIIAVDLKAIGVTRDYNGALPVRYIRSYWSLGSILRFEEKSAKRNIRLGYLDAMRSYRELDGMAYAFEKDTIDAFAASGTAERAWECLDPHEHSSRSARSQLAKSHSAHRNARRRALGFLETAAELLDLDYLEIWTPEEMNEAIKLKLERSDDFSYIADAAAKIRADGNANNVSSILSSKELLTAAYASQLDA